MKMLIVLMALVTVGCDVGHLRTGAAAHVLALAVALTTSAMARHATLASRFPSFLARPLMGRALGMRRLAALAGDLALLLPVHRGESAILFCHADLLHASFAAPPRDEASRSRSPYRLTSVP